MQLFSQNHRRTTLHSMSKVLPVCMCVIENTAELLALERFNDQLTKAVPVARPGQATFSTGTSCSKASCWWRRYCLVTLVKVIILI